MIHREMPENKHYTEQWRDLKELCTARHLLPCDRVY